MLNDGQMANRLRLTGTQMTDKKQVFGVWSGVYRIGGSVLQIHHFEP